MSPNAARTLRRSTSAVIVQTPRAPRHVLDGAPRLYPTLHRGVKARRQEERHARGNGDDRVDSTTQAVAWTKRRRPAGRSSTIGGWRGRDEAPAPSRSGEATGIRDSISRHRNSGFASPSLRPGSQGRRLAWPTPHSASSKAVAPRGFSDLA